MIEIHWNNLRRSRIRLSLETDIFSSVIGENGHRKRIFLKALCRMKNF